MKKRILSFLLYAFILFCMEGKWIHAAEPPLLPAHDEEYAVFAAVLFPKEPKPELGQKPSFYTGPAHLDGITADSYRLNRFTITGSRTPGRGDDQEMTADYNRKNKKVYRLDEKRLLSLLPKGGSVILVDPEENRKTGKTILSSGGTTYVSRPGFNPDMTRAMLQINHVADPEMGVGYQVYLEKTSGQWTITGFDLNRRY